MSAPDISRAINSRVRAIHAPTGFTSSPAYGGTRMGMMNKFVLRIWSQRFEVLAEEYHGQVVEILEGQAQRVEVGAVLREYDTDMLTAVCGSSNPVALTYTTRRGQLGSARAVALLAAPLDPGLPGFYIPRAIPMLNPAAEVRHALQEEWGTPIVWHMLPDSSGRLLQLGPIEAFTL